MEIQEILKALQFNDGQFPRKALEEAVANQEAITPRLLEILEHAEQNIREIAEQPRYMAHIYAMFLLAQFRENRAYSLIAKFFSLPGELTLELTGDVVTEDLNRILASVSHGDTSLMKQLVENEDINEYARNAALEGMLTLVACGEIPREDLIDYCQSLFQGKLAREPSHIWNGLAVVSMDLYAGELLEDIKKAYEDELIDPFFIVFKDIERNLELGKEKVLERLQNNRRHKLIEDTMGEMEGWACFEQPKRKLRSFPTAQTVKKSPKVGRNQPCPCGSGKKYKKCCGRYD